MPPPYGLFGELTGIPLFDKGIKGGADFIGNFYRSLIALLGVELHPLDLADDGLDDAPGGHADGFGVGDVFFHSHLRRCVHCADRWPVDLILCRAGASTLSELSYMGKPVIIVPSPNVTDNHQEKNARVLADRGGAVLLLEKDCTAQTLYDTVKALLADQKRRDTMSIVLRHDVILDSAERICDILDELTHKS